MLIVQPPAGDVYLSTRNEILAANNPKLVSGLVLWLDANNLNDYYNEGDGVQTWYDKSGYGHNATQATSGNRPILRKNRWNGNSVVAMTYSSPKYMSITRTADLEPTTITIFAAYHFFGGSASAYLLSKPYTNSTWATPYSSYSLHASYATITGRLGGHVAAPGGLKQAYTENTFNAYSSAIGCFIYDGSTTFKEYINLYQQTLTVAIGGALSGNIQYPNQTDLSLFTQSHYVNGQYFTGYVGDILIYNNVLSDTNRTFVFNYLLYKYGVMAVTTTTPS